MRACFSRQLRSEPADADALARRRSAGVLALVLALGLAACDGRGGADEPAGKAAVEPAAATAIDAEDIPSIPRPELSALAEDARQKIEGARAEMDAALDEPGVPTADKAALLGRQGQLYHAHDLFQAAEACYRAASQLAPGDFGWPYLLGRLQLAANDLEEGVRLLREALAIDPGYTPARVALADGLLELDRVDEAEAEMRAALDEGPESAALLIAMARVRARQEDHAAIVELLTRAKALAPEASEVNYPLGLAYRALGETEQAEALLNARGRVKAPLSDRYMDQVASITTGSAANVNRGVEAMGQGDLEEAEREFRKAIESDPQNISAHLNLAVALSQQGDAQGAFDALQEALRIDPENPRANFNMASLLAGAGRVEDSIALFQKAVESDPGYVNAHFNLANNLSRLGRPAEAAAHYARVVELDPGNRDARVMQAVSLMDADDWAEARAALTESRAALPEDAVLANAEARLLATAADDAVRDGAAALALADGLVAGTPAYEHLQARALALAELGRFDEALGVQRTLLEEATRTGNAAFEAAVRFYMAAFEAGEAPRRPWAPGDPMQPGVR